MTPPDYLAALRDPSPDGAREPLLSSLSLGLPIPRALRAALGLPGKDRTPADKQRWMAAWAGLVTVRGEDGEVREACEGVEGGKEESDGGHDLGGRPAARVGFVVVEGSQVEGSEMARLCGVSGKVANQGSTDDAAESNGAEAGERLRDDGSEQGEEAAPDAQREPERRQRASIAPQYGAWAVGDPVGGDASFPIASGSTPDLGAPHGGLSPSGRGRAEEESEKEGGGEGASEARAVQGEAPLAGMDGSAPRVAGLPPGWAPLRRVTVEEDERAIVLPTPLDHLMQVNEACAAYGMPRFSAWWVYSLSGFYRSGKPWGVFLVGRGGGKSTSLERVAASDAYYVERKIPPGQVWTWPFISIGPDDANRRVDGIAAVYRAIGLAFVGDETGEEDEKGKSVKVAGGEGVSIVHSPRAALSLADLAHNAIKLMSIAGTIGNVSGPSTIGLTVDEAAKLHDKSEHVNPLTEIIASGAQTSRGRAGWRAIVCSSPWEMGGTHSQLALRGDTETNFVATIGADFILAALRGFEDVARWEERGDPATKREPNPDAARRIREHAATLTSDSPMVPSWVANPTIGNPTGEPWEGAALATRLLVEVLPDQSLEGVPRILYWLRENGSLPLSMAEAKPGILVGVSITTGHDTGVVADRVVGIAPSAGAWGRVEVAFVGGEFRVLWDESEMDGDVFGGLSGVSVVACANDQARAVEAERLAWLSGRPASYLPPVAGQPIYDASVLRLSPLRTLYDRGRLRHAPGLSTLEAALRSHREDSDRNPRLEALLAAVTRLVACYPWVTAGGDGEPMRGPRAGEAMQEGGSGKVVMLRRLGAEPGHGGV